MGSPSSGDYLAPWSVTLNKSITITNPPDSNLSGCCGFSSSNATLSTIVFSVPKGTYEYQIAPSYVSESGMITVSGGNNVVQVD